MSEEAEPRNCLTSNMKQSSQANLESVRLSYKKGGKKLHSPSHLLNSVRKSNQEDGLLEEKIVSGESAKKEKKLKDKTIKKKKRPHSADSLFRYEPSTLAVSNQQPDDEEDQLSDEKSAAYMAYLAKERQL